jgi:hypothetical protein
VIDPDRRKDRQAMLPLHYAASREAARRQRLAKRGFRPRKPPRPGDPDYVEPFDFKRH